MTRFLAHLAFALAIIVLAVSLFALVGCATSTPQPTVTAGIKTETVYVSVREPCAFVDEVPAVPGSWMKPDGQTKEQRRAAVLADMDELEQYLIKADSLLRACAKPRPEAKPK